MRTELRELKDFPTLNWVRTEIADRRDRTFRCEFCGVAIIRFVHRLEHSEWFEFIRCGVCCAGHLTGDTVGSRVVERAFRLACERRDKWLNADWSRGKDGRLFLNRHGANLSVFPVGDGRFGAVVSRESGDWRKWAGKTYASETLAKNAALAVVIEALPSKEELQWSRKPSRAKSKSKSSKAKGSKGNEQLALALPK
jgi:hypothetical protein